MQKGTLQPVGKPLFSMTAFPETVRLLLQRTTNRSYVYARSISLPANHADGSLSDII